MIYLEKFENTLFESNSYVVWNSESKDCYLIDCGDFRPIKKFLEIHNLVIKSIFITHGHFDHIYGLNVFIHHYSDILIYTSNEAIPELFDSKLNYSRYQDESFIFEGEQEQIVSLTDGGKILLWDNVYLTAYATPGHDKSSLSFVIEDYIFTGDSFIPGLKTVTNLRGNKEHAEASEKKICNLIRERGLLICPGHGGISNGILTNV